MPDLLTESERPPWFMYPRHFMRAVELGINDLGPWQLLEGKCLRVRMDGLAKRYPDRQLVPFFRDMGSDDVACCEADKGERLVMVHDFAGPGWEDSGEFPFISWFKDAAGRALNLEWQRGRQNAAQERTNCGLPQAEHLRDRLKGTGLAARLALTQTLTDTAICR
jgi:hypothetical protein